MSTRGAGGDAGRDRTPRRSRRPGADPSNLWGNARGGRMREAMIETPSRSADLGAQAGVAVAQVSREFRAPHGRVIALRDVALRAATCQIAAVVGPSGCGKSTLLELICR